MLKSDLRYPNEQEKIVVTAIDLCSKGKNVSCILSTNAVDLPDPVPDFNTNMFLQTLEGYGPGEE